MRRGATRRGALLNEAISDEWELKRVKEDHSHLNVPYGLFTVVGTGGYYQIEDMTTLTFKLSAAGAEVRVKHRAERG